MQGNIPPFLLRPPPPYPAESAEPVSRTTFLDKSLTSFAALIKTTCIQWDTARRDGFFQKLDARVKVFFLLFFVVLVSIKQSLLPEAGIALFVCLLAGLSRLDLWSFYSRVSFLSFLFGFLVALPSCLNVIISGEVILPLVHFSKERCFWIWCIPETVGVTRQGLEGVLMLTLRVFNSLSLSFLVIYTTPFSEMIRALKSLKVPDPFLLIVTLSYQYIFLFTKTLEDLHLARKSKVIGRDPGEARNWVAGRMAFLLRKTKGRCEEVFAAMLARGFSGEVKLYAPRKIRKADLAWTSLLFFLGVLFLIF
ncbi:cobalt/nickel transport system permease protein [Syntrophus gentianae]|uniref:Cobalt/nickel transport system permease protein n=1 Tax=Syntrophus gentianae TaxID=43775 RepID=A0A1H8AE24_9BACT|nr:energy-coupling factor transporter transmembrane component T [Syntrophus gentianae]SEM68184.1 cobalt/nickel transport system permease protein [Syntrophus gentianae]